MKKLGIRAGFAALTVFALTACEDNTRVGDVCKRDMALVSSSEVVARSSGTRSGGRSVSTGGSTGSLSGSSGTTGGSGRYQNGNNGNTGVIGGSSYGHGSGGGHYYREDDCAARIE